jgi:ketosteroid isomerase-like protein
MRSIRASFIALLVTFSYAVPVLADDLRASMEADNAKWLAAYNNRTPGVLQTMYTADAMLLAPGVQPISGADAIGAFWDNRVKPGDKKNHTFDIVSLEQDGKVAYQVARWTVIVVKDTGETKLSGNTVRLFERQADGTWLTKVHIFNVH